MIKQEQFDVVLRFIESFMEENGYAPSVREICKQMGFKSTATAHSYLERMREMGMLNKTDNKKRAVSLQRNNNSQKIPLIGTVTAGNPILAYENYEDFYSFPTGEFKGSDLFMLNVQGNSMINANIFDGDKIIVRQQATAENGDIVVALIEDSATVKRFFKRDGKIILHPENPELSDFVFDHDIQILGKVIGLLRNI